MVDRAVLPRRFRPAFATAWVVVSSDRGWSRAPAPPAVALPAWTRNDTAALALVLLLVPVLVAVPFARLGSTDSTGTRQYHAYFIADFVWHTALVAELTKNTRRRGTRTWPPSRCTTTGRTSSSRPRLVEATGVPIEHALKLNALAAALLLVAAIFLAAWTALPRRPMAVALAVAMTILAASAEGLAATVDLLRRGHSLAELRNLNIDAIASWAFKGLRIDDLPRAMW